MTLSFFIKWKTRVVGFLLAGATSLACGILVLWPGIDSLPPALGVKRLNHWTTRKVLSPSFPTVKFTRNQQSGLEPTSFYNSTWKIERKWNAMVSHVSGNFCVRCIFYSILSIFNYVLWQSCWVAVPSWAKNLKNTGPRGFLFPVPKLLIVKLKKTCELG